MSCTGGSTWGSLTRLADVAALVSSARSGHWPDGSVYFGEIGLLGEVRGSRPRLALKEASALGFRTVFLPSGNAGDARGFSRPGLRPVDRSRTFSRG